MLEHQGISLARRKIERREIRERVSVAVSLVPDLVDHIEINPMAREMLPRKFEYLIQRDFWREQTFLTVPWGSSNEVIMSPRMWGRALPIGYGEVPFGSSIAGMVFAKGVFRTGGYYTSTDTSDVARPIGFYGSVGGAREQEVGNELLSARFRSSLVLVRIYYKEKQMRAFLLDAWKDQPKMREDIVTCFSFLQSSDDHPIFLARLGGVTSRLEDGYREGHLYTKAQLLWAMNLIQSELLEDPAGFEKRYLERVYLSINQTKKMLADLRNKHRLEKEDVFTLVSLWAGIRLANAEAISRLPLSLCAKYENLTQVLAASKDICLAGFNYDYEEAGTYVDDYGGLSYLSKIWTEASVIDRWVRILTYPTSDFVTMSKVRSTFSRLIT